MTPPKDPCPAHTQLAIDVARSEERYEALTEVVMGLRAEVRDLRCEMRDLAVLVRKLGDNAELEVARVQAGGNTSSAKTAGGFALAIALLEGLRFWLTK